VLVRAKVLAAAGAVMARESRQQLHHRAA